MTKTEVKPAIAAINELFAKGLPEIVRAVMQEMLETEMTEALRAEKGEPTARSARLSLGLLQPNSPHQGRQLELRVVAGSRRALLDQAIRTLSALRAGAGGDARQTEHAHSPTPSSRAKRLFGRCLSG
jgi:hypothetical protein